MWGNGGHRARNPDNQTPSASHMVTLKQDHDEQETKTCQDIRLEVRVIRVSESEIQGAEFSQRLRVHGMGMCIVRG